MPGGTGGTCEGAEDGSWQARRPPGVEGAVQWHPVRSCRGP